ncbi:MAG: FtsX-like permease family protein [Actinomycetota bacterium]
MRAIRRVVCLEFTSGLRRFIALAMLVGLMGGITLAAVAGARRTDTSFTRMLQTFPGPDVIIPNIPDPSGGTAVFDASTVRSIPGVRIVTGTEPLVMMIHGLPTVCVAHIDPHLGDRNGLLSYKILEGRQPDPRRLDEAIANYVAAQRLHLHVGDRLPLELVPPFDKLLVQARVPLPSTVRVVGFYAGPSEIFGAEQDIPALHFSAAFAHLFPPFVIPSLLVALRGGPAAVPAFLSALDARANGKRVQVIQAHLADRDTQHAIHAQGVAMWLLAGLLTVTGMLIVAQTLIRQAYVEGRENTALASLGMSRRQLWAKTIFRAVTILIAGSVLSVLVMYLMSPLMPVGIARLAEPNPGFAFDGMVAGLGALGLIVVPIVLILVPTLFAVNISTTQEVVGVGRSSRTNLSGRLPLTAGLGTSLAFDRRSWQTSLPARTTIGSMSVAFAGVTAALVFATSLTHLLGTPRLYGLTWDTALGGATTDARRATRALLSDGRVEGFAFGVTAIAFEVGGHEVDAELIDPPDKGRLGVVVLNGRAPMGAGELALGSRTMHDLHLHIGDVVTAGLSGGAPIQMHIVGRVVLEPANAGARTGFVTAQELRLGDGALAAYSGFAGIGHGALPPAQAFIRFAPGANRTATEAALVKSIGGDVGATTFSSPSDVIVFGRLQNLPLILTVVLAVVALATLIHMLLAGAYRKRKDLAILKTLGLAGRQIISTVIWQADILAGLGVAFGALIGIFGGRWLWNLLVSGVGVVAEPRLSSFALLGAAAGMIVISSTIALGPGLVAERVKPAVVLRTE